MPIFKSGTIIRAIYFLCFCLILGTLAPTGTSSVFASSTISVEQVLNVDGSLDPSANVNGTLDLHGWNVTLDSKRGPILTPSNKPVDSITGADNADFQIQTPSTTPPAAWVRLLHNSMIGGVYAIAFVGNDMYIGGNFSFIPDGSSTSLNHIAKYSNGVWSALAHNGLNTTVSALAVIGTDLYVGGSFNMTADTTVQNLNNIAKYDTVAQTWNSLANLGLGNSVYALQVLGSDLYVGGFFNASADGMILDLNGIARYNGGTWNALAHKGVNGYVSAFSVIGTDLYVGGTFDFTFDFQVQNLTNLAKYSGSAWSAVPHHGLNHGVLALTSNGTDLYAGGVFTQTQDSGVSNLNHIAKLDTVGGTWFALAHTGLNNNPDALTFIGSDLYVGGYFTKSFDNAVLDLNHVAKYDTIGGTWSALPNKGLSDVVRAFLLQGNDLYVGGDFAGTGDALTFIGQIVRLGNFKLYLPLILR